MCTSGYGAFIKYGEEGYNDLVQQSHKKMWAPPPPRAFTWNICTQVLSNSAASGVVLGPSSQDDQGHIHISPLQGSVQGAAASTPQTQWPSAQGIHTDWWA